MKIVIINYGAGNIQSIMFAIERLVLQQYLVTIEGNKSDKVIFRALVRQVLQ
jgi:glutamine amidotransferase